MSDVDTAQPGPPVPTGGRDQQGRAEHILHCRGQMLFSTGITNACYGRKTQALLQPRVPAETITHREGTLSLSTKTWVTGAVSPGVDYCDINPFLWSTRHPSYENTIIWLYNITAQYDCITSPCTKYSPGFIIYSIKNNPNNPGCFMRYLVQKKGKGRHGRARRAVAMQTLNLPQIQGLQNNSLKTPFI